MKKAIVAVLLLSAGLGLLFWRYTSGVNQKSGSGLVELTLWGLWEDEKAIRPVIESYSKTHPKVKITYVKQSSLNYQSRSLAQIQAGQGPDILEVHSSWMPMFLDKLLPAPASVITADQFSQYYYPIAGSVGLSSGKVYALPLEIDGLALFLNEDILKAGGVNPPSSWQEFVESAKRVTVRSQEGQIQTAGAALGTASNVDFWPEIIELLFLQQPNANLATPASKDGAEVLQFYTSFVIDPKSKTWDVTLPSSTQMFSQGKLAFYFAPYRKVQEIKATNPSLAFKIIPVPKLPARDITLGEFWMQGVSASSKNPNEAWEFLNYLSSPQSLAVVNRQRAQLGLGVKPYPRMDLATTLKNDPLLGAFVNQAPFYKTWYLNTDTQTVGINKEMGDLYGQAINAVLQGQPPLSALQAIEPSVKQVLDKYKIQ